MEFKVQQLDTQIKKNLENSFLLKRLSTLSTAYLHKVTSRHKHILEGYIWYIYFTTQNIWVHCLQWVKRKEKEESTLKCLSIGTPNLINFPFVSNVKLMVFRCPNIQAHYNEAVLCLKFGAPENNEFSIWNKWKIYYF